MLLDVFTQKNYSWTLYSTEIELVLFSKNGKFILESPFGDLWVTYALYLHFFEKPLITITEHISLAVFCCYC